jgi:hypothetical protein
MSYTLCHVIILEELNRFSLNMVWTLAIGGYSKPILRTIGKSNMSDALTFEVGG